MRTRTRSRVHLLIFMAITLLIGCSSASQKKATLDFPESHPAHELKRGQYSIKDGVIFEHLPDGSRKKTLIAGVPLDQQPDFDISPEAIARLSPIEAALRKRQLVDWAANYDGQYLPAKKQDTLRSLYEKYSEEASDISRRERAGSISASDAIHLRSEKLADFIIERRQLFEGHTKAQIHLYGRPITVPAENIDKALLVSALEGFVSGQYLQKKPAVPTGHKRFYQRSPLSQLPKRADSLPMTELPRGSGSPPAMGQVASCDPSPIAGETRRVYSDGTTEFVGFSANIFRTEHTAVVGDIPGPIDDILDSENVKHTNIATSIWTVNKHERTVKVYNGNTLIVEKSWDVYTSDRVQYGLVNGCAGTYEADDDFIYVASSTHPTLADALEHLYQYQPPHRIRAGAYPAGCFGADWFCHQACNSYASRKWDIIPVHYTFSFLGFGNFGDRGISPDTDSCGREHPGCVPGAGCYYNSQGAHNACPPGCGSGENALNTGQGWDLQTAWDPDTESWIASGVRFTSVAIPAAWNNRPGHFETEQCSAPPAPPSCERSSDCPDQWLCSGQSATGWGECPGNGSTDCICVPDEVAAADQYPSSSETPSDIEMYLGKQCDGHNDCGQTLWCLNSPGKFSGRCGYFPEVCSNDFMCPKDTRCGTLAGPASDPRFSACTPEKAAAGQCRCEYPSGPAR